MPACTWRRPRAHFIVILLMQAMWGLFLDLRQTVYVLNAMYIAIGNCDANRVLRCIGRPGQYGGVKLIILPIELLHFECSAFNGHLNRHRPHVIIAKVGDVAHRLKNLRWPARRDLA